MNRWLLLAGTMSAAASLLHLGVIAGGPAWYRFFGAGEGMARLAERGDPKAALITLGIAGVLAVWAAFAFSGAGLIPRLPLLRTGLVVITGIYLLRGLVLIPAIALNPQGAAGITPFVWWSSLIVLAYGLVHAIGTWTAWSALSPARG